MDVLGSLYLLIPEVVFHQQWSSVCRQVVLEPAAYLHQEAVVRGDLHFGNIVFKIPGINQYTEVEMYELMGEPKLIPVIPHDHSVPSDSLPKYLVAAPETTHFMPKEFAEILKDQLTISNTGWEASQASRHAAYHPSPSADVLQDIRRSSQRRVGLPSDVWSMACTKIAFSDVMLTYGSDDDNMLIYETMKLVSPLPERWKPYWDSKPFEDSDGNFTVDPDVTWKERCPTENDDDASAVTVLRDMLCWEPMSRPTAADLLQHPWFAT
ncbi:hypothetical protein F4604DRAFT_1677494 [Suillus subluteus]|nr:hypothetical protein F4604DRAFT_1677494 [Suillus subluteus]